MSKRLPWVWTGIVAVASVVATVPWVLDPGTSAAGAIPEVVWAMLPVLFTALGATISTRVPGNHIARLLYISGAGILLDAAVIRAVAIAPAALTFGVFVLLLVNNTAWLAVFLPLFLTLYVFPDGRFLSDRWRRSVLGLEAAIVSTIVFSAFLSEEIGPSSDAWLIENPIGFVPASLWEGPFIVVWAVAVLSLVSFAFVAIVVRYRRSSTTVRTQIKWVVFGGVVLVAGYSVTFIGTGWSESLWFGLPLFLAVAALPVTITVAIVRYRLYEINRILSRTVGYSVVIVLLLAVYLLGAVYLPTVIAPDGAPAPFVAAATLSVAALFQPLRRRVLDLVDRRFYRSRYVAEQEVEALSGSLRDELDPAEVSAAWLSTSHRIMQPSVSSIWIRPG